MWYVCFQSIANEEKNVLLLGGITGAFLTGLFAEKSWNSNGADGAFYGRPIQMWYQIAGILTAIGISLSPFRAYIHLIPIFTY